MRQEGDTAAGRGRWDRVRQPEGPLPLSASALSTGLDAINSIQHKCQDMRAYSNLANQEAAVPWPGRSYPADNSRPSVTLGWGPGENAHKGQSHKVDAERNTELLVTPGFSHT